MTARQLAWWAAGCLAFVVAATANGGGYRYGASDQAFYIPVVTRALDPASFPRDAALIDSQGRLMLSDEIVAAVVRVTGLSLETLFLAGYLLSLLLIWSAIVAIGRTVYPTPWLIAALAAAFTLRHRIPHTSANSFEPYFHPRMLAFGVGALAVAALLRRRIWTAAALVAAAALLHVTTGLWFAVLIGPAALLLDRRFRRIAVPGAAAAAVLLAWSVSAGPLQASSGIMDSTWLGTLTGKDLFPSAWPAWAWAANLALIVVAWSAVSFGAGWRDEAARPTAQVRALLWGATALVALFLLTLPLVEAHVALPIQLQISRVFWLVDFVTLVCLIGLVRRERTARLLVAAIAALAIGRGAYVMALEHPERPLFSVTLPHSDWHDAMRWIRRRPLDAHVLADPGHAWKYGTSVRVAAERDVFLEEVKDAAIAMYSRDVAVRLVERSAALPPFESLEVGVALRLARQYGLDYLVTEADLPLPVTYRNARFRIYALASEPSEDVRR